jgi:hypothetical protein
MRPLDTRAVLWLADGPAVGAGALARALRPMGYVAPSRPVPETYVALPGERLRFAWGDAGARSWLVPDDPSRVFKLCHALSRVLTGRGVWAAHRDLRGALVFKVFGEGRAAFKLGQDPDDEVPYPIMSANPEGLRQLLRDEGRRDRELEERMVQVLARDEHRLLEALFAELGVDPTIPAYKDLTSDKAARLDTFVDERSRLAW